MNNQKKLKERLLEQNETFVPKYGETLAAYYARTSDYWTKEAFHRESQNIGFFLFSFFFFIFLLPFSILC